MPLSLLQESVDAEGPVVEKIMSCRSVKKQVSTVQRWKPMDGTFQVVCCPCKVPPRSWLQGQVPEDQEFKGSLFYL